MKPSVRNKKGQPLLLYKRGLLGRSQTLPLIISNQGTLPSKVSVPHQMSEQGAICLLNDSSKRKNHMRLPLDLGLPSAADTLKPVGIIDILSVGTVILVVIIIVVVIALFALVLLEKKNQLFCVPLEISQKDFFCSKYGMKFLSSAPLKAGETAFLSHSALVIKIFVVVTDAGGPPQDLNAQYILILLAWAVNRDGCPHYPIWQPPLLSVLHLVT